jgi:predicted lipoprotein
MTIPKLSTLLSLCAKVCSLAILGGVGVASTPAAAQLAEPFYQADQVMHAFYQHSALPKAVLFNSQAHALEALLGEACDQPGQLSKLQTHWAQTMLAWEALQTPTVGVLVDRRSQRHIDFWPSRDKLIAQALRQTELRQLDMDLVGSPAKGLPALAVLLGLSPTSLDVDAVKSAARCTFANALAADIAAESVQLLTAVSGAAQTDWATDAAATQAAWEQLVNQWLGALERLRWTYINKPMHMALTRNDSPHAALTSDGTEPSALSLSAIEWPRPSWQLQLQALQAQWAQLYDLASSAGPASASTTGVISLQALLRSRGHVSLADKWGESVQQAHVAIGQLGRGSSTTQLQVAALELGLLAQLFQNQLASALGVQMGFSDADGD